MPPEACFADEVVQYQKGTKNNGSPLDANRTDPSKALGVPENDDTYNFVTLGFDGSIILQFNNAILNNPGDDFTVVETTFGKQVCSTYAEKVHAYASQNAGGPWTDLGIGCLDSPFDLGGLDWARYIKLEDSTNPEDFSTIADGYDLDGIIASDCMPLGWVTTSSSSSSSSSSSLIATTTTLRLVVGGRGGGGVMLNQGRVIYTPPEETEETAATTMPTTTAKTTTMPSEPTTTLKSYTTTMPSGVGGLIFDVCDMDHCSDNVRNCNETGVDCGGECPDCTPGITGRFVQYAGGGLLMLLLLLFLLILFYVRRRKKKESESE